MHKASGIELRWDTPVFIEWNWARTDHRPPALLIVNRVSAFPGTSARGLPSGVGKLDSGDRAVLFDESRDARQRFDVRARPNAHVLQRNAADRLDRCRFYHH